MAPKVRFDGVEVEVESHEELLRLLRDLGVHAAGLPTMTGVTMVLRSSVTTAQLERFLSLLEEAGGRVRSQELAQAAGLAGPKSLPGALRTWRKILGQLGYALQDVAVNERRGGVSTWTHGPKTSQALEELRRLDGLKS